MPPMSMPLSIPKFKIDLIPTLFKIGACFILFVGMLLASAEEIGKSPYRKIQEKRMPKFPNGHVHIDSYITAYICIAMTIILLEVGNIVISALGGLNKLGDIIWQLVNAVLTFCVAFMWCYIVQFWRVYKYPIACPRKWLCMKFTKYTTYKFLYVLNIVAMILAFISGGLFLAAAFFRLYPLKMRARVGNSNNPRWMAPWMTPWRRADADASMEQHQQEAQDDRGRPIQGEDPTSVKDLFIMVKNAKLEIDDEPILIKGAACFVLFVGMILACYEDMEVYPKKRYLPPGGWFGQWKVPSGHVPTDSCLAAYISIFMAVTTLEVGNIVITMLGGINRMGDKVWQGINAVLAFSVAFIYCYEIHKWRKITVRLRCQGGHIMGFCSRFIDDTPVFYFWIFNWIAMFLAFASGIIFLVAVFFNPKPRVRNAAVSGTQQISPPSPRDSDDSESDP